jgi:hypothetical protein
MRELKFRALDADGAWVYYGTAIKGTVDNLQLMRNEVDMTTIYTGKEGKRIRKTIGTFRARAFKRTILYYAINLALYG